MGTPDFPVETTKTQEEYKTTYGMFALLGSPILLGADMASLKRDHPALLELLLNPEVVALQQDPGCVQASLARFQGAGQIWAKPIAASPSGAERFGVGLLNLGDRPQNVTMCWTNAISFPTASACYERMLGGPGDLNPSDFHNASLRDLWGRKDLGVFQGSFTAEVPAHGLQLLVVTSADAASSSLQGPAPGADGKLHVPRLKADDAESATAAFKTDDDARLHGSRSSGKSGGGKAAVHRVVNPVQPTDGMIIRSDMTLMPGEWQLPHGLVIVRDLVTVTMTGVTIVGSGRNDSGSGLTLIGRSGVKVVGGTLRDFQYGLRVEQSRSCSATGMVLSNNWRDPKALSAHPPWLDINAPPDLSDRQNLGGGAFLLRCVDVALVNITADNQENGFDVYHSAGIQVLNCQGSNNSGWGVHLHNTSSSIIQGGRFNYCNRAGLGDSAGMLLVNGSHSNVIDGNKCRRGGDGFFIGNENGSPSDFNTVTNNDCSYASANAFECTFSNGNYFANNKASYSTYGFWLGYSYNSTVSQNEMLGCGTGVQIDHGQKNTVEKNR
jgi:parallel beta-helix repeat protein